MIVYMQFEFKICASQTLYEFLFHSNPKLHNTTSVRNPYKITFEVNR